MPERPVCFKCGDLIESAVKVESNDDYWDYPCGVLFTGGGNFGSAIYDTLMDGVYVQLIICDKCLKDHDNMLRHKTEKK